MRTHVERHRIPAFLAVVFGWTWAWDAVYYTFDLWRSLPIYINTFPRQWGLPIGAVVVVWASDVPVRQWLGRVLNWRLSPWVSLGAVVVPLFITNIQPFFAAVGGGSVRFAPPAPLHLLFGFFLLNVFLFGGIEEFGWRGFLQPELQKRLSVLSAGIAVGMVWWLWHVPLFLGHPNFTLDPRFLVEYTTFILGASVVLGALINRTDGGVIPAVCLHAAINVGGVFIGSGGALDGTLLISLVVASGAWWLIVAVLVWMYGRSMTPGYQVTPPT